MLDLEAVGEKGEAAGLMGEVGESKSLEPVESFVRFFLRKPRVGIEATGGMLPLRPKRETEADGVGG